VGRASRPPGRSQVNGNTRLPCQRPRRRDACATRLPNTHMERLQRFAAEFVNSTREYIFIRPEDRLLIMRPNKTHHLNATACEMLRRLYDQPEVDVPALVAHFAAKFGAAPERIEKDLEELLKTLAALLKNAPCGATAVKQTPFGTHEIKYPVLSEIALTYRCQNKCSFCYADAPRRGRSEDEMTTAQVKTVIDRIWNQAKAPTVSFTGGEPTLRLDLPEVVAYAKSLGMRTNLITNGVRCADEKLVCELKDAGLDSAQVSLEAARAEVHDAITRNAGSFDKCVQGIRNLRKHGIHTHTNTTICPENRDHLLELVDFVADDLRHEYLSMNMVIRTGTAVTASYPTGDGASPPDPLSTGRDGTSPPDPLSTGGDGTSPPRPPSPQAERGENGANSAAGGVLHAPVPGYIYDLSRKLRREGTPTEAILWEALRDRRFGGWRFRRQHPLGRYVADFYCRDARLVVEVDGGVHDDTRQHQYDAIRDKELTARGLRLCRVRAVDVKRDLQGVLNCIASQLPADLTPFTPLSACGEGGRGGEVAVREAMGESPSLGTDVIGYSEIESVVLPIIARAKLKGLRFVWYSPVPYCLFNPIVHGLGGNSCAAADGLLSIAPDGQVLPCSSFETGIGNLLHEPFDRIWNRRTARYWRNKEFLPPACADCDMKHLCCGACPLYWDEQRGFAELPDAARAGSLAQMQWRLKRRFIGRVKGINVR